MGGWRAARGALEVWAEKRAASRSMRAPRGGGEGGAPADEYAYVSCMCVKDEFRRRGVADALLRAAEKVALDWGYDCAALHVFRRNEPAIALRAAAGTRSWTTRARRWTRCWGSRGTSWSRSSGDDVARA